MFQGLEGYCNLKQGNTDVAFSRCGYVEDVSVLILLTFLLYLANFILKVKMLQFSLVFFLVFFFPFFFHFALKRIDLSAGLS